MCAIKCEQASRWKLHYNVEGTQGASVSSVSQLSNSKVSHRFPSRGKNEQFNDLKRKIPHLTEKKVSVHPDNVM